MENKNNEQSLKERYIATLLGCALGDTLGMAVEGWKPSQIQKYIGKITQPMAPVMLYDKDNNLITQDEFGKYGYYTKNYKLGEYTDDTILTIAIAESIADKKKLDLIDVCKKQINAYENFLEKNGNNAFGFGKTTINAFENIKNGISPLYSASSPGLGNGIAMKVSPIGLYMNATGKHIQGLNFARLVGQATHKDERAIVAGILQAHAVCTLLNNPSREEFLENILETSLLCERPQEYEALKEKGNLTEKLEWVINNQDKTYLEARARLKVSCLAFESYPFTIFMFQKYFNQPLEGLIQTVNMGGDCDTTGAMFGALAGAKHGMFFPKEWLAVLENKEYIEKLGRKLYDLKKE
ncbi:MAG: ADP-ribosylglycohydrolase family protein [Candidatus Nanoarchaeia archaeon]